MASGSAVLRNAAMLLASEPAQLQQTSSVTRREEAGSSCVSQAIASGVAVLPDMESGNILRAMPAAASARADEGSIEATSAAALMRSLAAVPFTTPATALLRLRPERFSSHQLSADVGSCFPHTSTKAALMRLRVKESA